MIVAGRENLRWIVLISDTDDESFFFAALPSSILVFAHYSKLRENDKVVRVN